MPNVPIKNLLPLIMNRAPSCPGFIAEFEARMAAVEFCERTRCWRHKLDIPMTGPTADPVVPAEQAIHVIEQASIGDCPLTPTQYTNFDDAGDGEPEYITQLNAGGIAIFPFNEPVTVSMTVFLKPRSDQGFGIDPADPLFDRFNVLPDWMVTMHARTLADGALSRILSMKSKPWTDLQAAAIHRAAFDQGMTDHAHSAVRGQQRTRLRVRYNDF